MVRLGGSGELYGVSDLIPVAHKPAATAIPWKIPLCSPGRNGNISEMIAITAPAISKNIYF